MDLNDLNNLDISDIDFNNMGSWPNAAKGAVAALVFSLVVGLAYYLFIGSQTDLLVSIERKEFDLKKKRSCIHCQSSQLLSQHYLIQ